MSASGEMKPPNSKHDLVVDIPISSDGNSKPSKPSNLAKQELLKAVEEGNLKAVKLILNKDIKLLTAIINDWDETALHVAVHKEKTLIIKYLVSLMKEADLELKNYCSNTALHLVAGCNNVGIAKILVNKNKTLLDIEGRDQMLPLHMAAASGQRNMVQYLYKESKNRESTALTAEDRGRVLLACVLLACIHADLFDVAQQIVTDYPDLAQSYNVLEALSCKHDAFNIKKLSRHYKAYDGNVDEGNQAVQLLITILNKIPRAKLDDILRGPADQIMAFEMPAEACRKYSSRVLFAAVKNDNTAFVAVLIRHDEKLALQLNDMKQNLYQFSVLHRRAEIFKLLLGIASIKDLMIEVVDENGNNLLHLTGILEETLMSNRWQDLKEADVRMEVEDMWFKIVRGILPPKLREKKNKAGLKPLDLFMNNHKELLLTAIDSEKKVASGFFSPAVGVLIAVSGSTIYQYSQDIGPLSTPYMIVHGILLLLFSTVVFSSSWFSSYTELDFFLLRSRVKLIKTLFWIGILLVPFGVVIMFLIKEPFIVVISVASFSLLSGIVCYYVNPCTNKKEHNCHKML